MTHQDSDQDTPYHTITKPAFEKDPWDHDYYDFVDAVDANLKLSGSIGNRPSSSDAPDDAWYEATDQGLIYRNDPDSGWVAIAGVGSNSQRVPGTAYYETVNASEVTTDALDSRNGYTDKTSNRSFDTWYQNTTGADLDLSVFASVTSDATDIQLLVDVSDSQSNKTIVSSRDTAADTDRDINVYATVPDGFYYRVRGLRDNASFSLTKWFEQQ